MTAFAVSKPYGLGAFFEGIPFDDTIKKGTDLYNLYHTNIHEKIAVEKEKGCAGQE